MTVDNDHDEMIMSTLIRNDNDIRATQFDMMRL